MLIFKKRSRPMIRRLLALMLPIITSQAAIVGMNFLIRLCQASMVQRIWLAWQLVAIYG